MGSTEHFLKKIGRGKKEKIELTPEQERELFLKKREQFLLDSEDLRERAKSYYKEFSMEWSKNLETNIEKQVSLPVISRSIDKILLEEAQSREYTFQNPKIYLNPFGIAPLTAMILFQTKKPFRVRATVEGLTNSNADVAGTTQEDVIHRVPVIGLYPNRENEILLELLDSAGTVKKSRKVTVVTEALPKKLHRMVKKIIASGSSAYNLTIVSGKSTAYPYAFDCEGRLRYYLTYRSGGYGIFPLTNHRFIIPEHNVLIPTYDKLHTAQMYEMDYMGRVYQIYRVEKGYHHSVIEKVPGGNLLALSNSIEGHHQDAVSELDRQTGEVIKTLDLHDIFGDVYCDQINWAHLNAVSYNEKTDTILISPRNLHSAAKINWTTNELEWILCDPRFWEGTELYNKVLKPEGNIIWHYQQHAVYEIPEDIDGDPTNTHIIMFDNHWHKRRSVPFFDGNESTSYVTIYTIDDKNKTVRQDKLFEGVKSKITSNAILDYKSRHIFSMGGFLEPPIEDRQGMIYEFDYDTKEIINQYAIRYFFFRAYEMVLDYAVLSKPMETEKHYIKGTLRKPEQIEQREFVINRTLTESDEINFVIKERTLYMLAKNRTVQNIYLKGEKGIYYYDLKDTEETIDDVFKNRVYYTAVLLEHLPEDNYHLYVECQEKMYDTEKNITIY